MFLAGFYSVQIVRGGAVRIAGPYTGRQSAESTARHFSDGRPFEIREISTAAELKNLKRWKP